MRQSGLHKEGAIYPRRYFDDLIMENSLAAQQSGFERQYLSQSVQNASQLKDLVSSKLPFGLISDKQTMRGSYAKKRHMVAAVQASHSFMNAQISDPLINEDETNMSSMLAPRGKGSARYSRHKSPSNGNFIIPGSLTLDTDSEMNQFSKLQIREKLINNSTTRNIRNRTIDVPGLQLEKDVRSAKKTVHARSNLGHIKLS